MDSAGEHKAQQGQAPSKAQAGGAELGEGSRSPTLPPGRRQHFNLITALFGFIVWKPKNPASTKGKAEPPSPPGHQRLREHSSLHRNSEPVLGTDSTVHAPCNLPGPWLQENDPGPRQCSPVSPLHATPKGSPEGLFHKSSTGQGRGPITPLTILGLLSRRSKAWCPALLSSAPRRARPSAPRSPLEEPGRCPQTLFAEDSGPWEGPGN